MAAPSSDIAPKSESSSINVDSLVVKQEQSHEDVSGEISESKEVKSEPIEVKQESMEKQIDIMDENARVEKFKRYEADYKQYLMSKYFSDKTSLGGNIFDVKSNIEGQTISASRFPPFQSFVDPASFLELIRKELSSSDETLTSSDSNEKP